MMKFVQPSVRRPSFRHLYLILKLWPRTPVHALIGYDGVTWDREMADAPPVPVRGIVLGALILATGVVGWALGRLWRRAWA